MLNSVNNPELQELLNKLSVLETKVANLEDRDYIVEQGDGYIRWNKGKQICYGMICPTGNDQNYNVTFAKPFRYSPNAYEFPSVTIQKSGQKGWGSTWAPRDWAAFLTHIDENGFRMKATNWQSGMIYPWSAVGE